MRMRVVVQPLSNPTVQQAVWLWVKRCNTRKREEIKREEKEYREVHAKKSFFIIMSNEVNKESIVYEMKV